MYQKSFGSDQLYVSGREASLCYIQKQSEWATWMCGSDVQITSRPRDRKFSWHCEKISQLAWRTNRTTWFVVNSHTWMHATTAWWASKKVGLRLSYCVPFPFPLLLVSNALRPFHSQVVPSQWKTDRKQGQSFYRRPQKCWGWSCTQPTNKPNWVDAKPLRRFSTGAVYNLQIGVPWLG